MTGVGAIVAYSLCWAAFGVASGWIAHRVPARWLDTDRGLLRLRRWEERGRWYDRHLRVRRWQRLLPDAGAVFPGGRRKSEVLGFDTPSLEAFAVETRRAELVHWANIAFGVTFAAWTPAPVAATMILFAAVAHLPFVVAQRYNRARVVSILVRRGRQSPPRRRSAVRLAKAAAITAALAGMVVTVGAIRRPPTEAVSLEAASRRARADGGAATATRQVMPAEGVYRYAGEGSERLGAFGATRQGPVLPATVEHLSSSCWSFRIDFNTRHWQRVDFCVEDGRLEERGGRSEQRFDLVALEVGATTDTTCDPGIVHERSVDRIGVRSPAECTVVSSGAEASLRSTGTTELLGRTAVEVDGRRRPAWHYRRARDISGSQAGEERSEWWLDAETGLPLRNERTTTLRTGSPIGDLTYEERGSFILDRLRPL